MKITMDMFGKNHWSMLAYVETLCVDAKGDTGTINKSRVRCNSYMHPLLNQNGFTWKDSWGTRINGKTIASHDDWDCLDDLEAEGFVEVISLTQGFVKMTPEGMELAAELRKHKSSGGMYANFRNPVTA